MQSTNNTVIPFLYSRRFFLLDIKYNSADEVILLLAIEIHVWQYVSSRRRIDLQ